MKKKKNTIDDVFEAVNNGFSNMEKRMATKDDLNIGLQALETRLTNKIDKVQESVENLDKKLIDDTGVITGTEQKHFRSLTQRVAKLEKHVFKTS